jgi:hypothetical protein
MLTVHHTFDSSGAYLPNGWELISNQRNESDEPSSPNSHNRASSLSLGQGQGLGLGQGRGQGIGLDARTQSDASIKHLNIYSGNSSKSSCNASLSPSSVGIAMSSLRVNVVFVVILITREDQLHLEINPRYEQYYILFRAYISSICLSFQDI